MRFQEGNKKLYTTVFIKLLNITIYVSQWQASKSWLL